MSLRLQYNRRTATKTVHQVQPKSADPWSRQASEVPEEWPRLMGHLEPHRHCYSTGSCDAIAGPKTYHVSIIVIISIIIFAIINMIMIIITGSRLSSTHNVGRTKAGRSCAESKRVSHFPFCSLMNRLNFYGCRNRQLVSVVIQSSFYILVSLCSSCTILYVNYVFVIHVISMYLS